MHENDDPPQGSGDSVAGEFGNGDESNGQDDRETAFSDSKDDMFVDAPEELNFETPSKESVAKGDDNNGTLGVDEFKNGKETLDRELAGLQEQLTLLTGEDDLSGQDGNIVVGSSLHEVVGQFSKFLENVKEERVRHENALRELQGIVNKKDSEITDLTAKISELSNSLDVASAAEVAQTETIQQIEASVDRILFSLSAVFGQEELQYGSVPEKLTLAEYRVSLLSAKYTEFYYGIDQLKKCLSRDEAELSMQEDFGSVLGAACSELFELKQKEAVLFEKLSHLEEENTKLAEQVCKERETIESINAEFGKTKADLEQERTRCANTKEKLSMAVTKGKALVQQRDALKQSLLERTTELENRLTELQEKKNALETSELMKGQLEQSLAEKTDELAECLSELHDKSVSLEAYELTTKELEQSLAEKSKELEDCLMKLQEVSTALDASEISKGELVKSETLVASYQEMLSQRNAFIENLEAILSQLEIPEEFQSVEILNKIRWLAEERKMLRDVSEEYNRLKDAILQIDLPEEISESNLEIRFDCLKESLFRSKADVSQLQYQIESLTTSLSAEIQEKDKIRMELDDVASKLNEMEENVHRVSLEKDRIVKKLVETSGLVAEEGAHNTSSDIFVDKSFEKIEERIRDSGDSSFIDGELFETIQRLLYVRDLELSLCQDILGEDILVRSQVSNLSNQLKVASQELASAKEENSVLEKDLERVEEKSSLLREKLSMAIKKGKGLVQDRENLKNQLEEKNSEINKLKLELEHIRELDAELVAVKDEKDHLEQSLSQSNAMLDKVIRLVDSITIPVDITSEDPSEKIDRLSLYFKELEKLKEEAGTLTSKLEETYASLKLVEDALSVAEDDINRLSEENRLLQAAKENVELELQKAVGDISSLTGRLDEAFATSKSYEEALRQAERNISDIITEKEEAQSCAAAAEMELEKVRQEALIQTNKLTEAHGTIESLENALSQSENNIQLLSKQFDDDKEVRKNLENELKKLKDDADFQSTKMTEAHGTIESLENALSQAENNIQLLSKQFDDEKEVRKNLENELKKLKDDADFQSTKMTEASMTIRSLEETLMKAEESHSALEKEKLKAEVEISTLSSKLNACMEELAGVSGNSQSRSLEIIDHLDNLQMLLKDDSLVSKVNEFLERKFRSIKDMELIVRDIRKHLAKKGLVAEELDNATEDNSIVAKPLLNGLDNSVNIGLEDSEGSVAGEDEISSCLRKIADGVKMRNEILENNFESFSTSLDLLVAALLENLTAARNDVINVLADHESLRENERSMEIIVQDQESTISTLRDNISVLLSACGEAVRELDLEVKNNLLDLENFSMLQFQENKTCGENEAREHLQGLDDSECIQRVKALSSATAKACTTIKCFEKTSSAAAILIREMEDKLNETSVALEKVVEERDLNHDKVLILEADAESFEALCRELKLQLEDFKAKEEKWHEKEKEFSSLYDKLMVKEQEANLISAADMRALFDKMNGIELPSTDLANGVDPQHPYDVKKLFYLVDCVSEMQNQLDLLSYKKDELESTLAEKAREIQSLKEVTEVQSAAGPELEKAKAELSVVITGLSKLLGILTGNDHMVEPKSAESWALLQALEKHATSLLLESEGSKSKVQELGLKLMGSQKLVDELSSKVKTLEDKLQSRAVQADVVQERSILEAPSSSEISEIDDMGSMAKSSGLAAPSAAQVRTLRKGSADHLAISIDSESEHLMNHNDADEDKGHVFKSLNMSGLIPKQGKMIADRVDGIWVSGGRVLMSRPGARLGVITYCLLLHLWLLASIL